MPDQTTLNLDRVRDHLDQWQARTALPEAAADRTAHTLASHVPALLAEIDECITDQEAVLHRLKEAEQERDQAAAAADALRRELAEAHATIRALVHDLTRNATTPPPPTPEDPLPHLGPADTAAAAQRAVRNLRDSGERVNTKHADLIEHLLAEADRREAAAWHNGWAAARNQPIARPRTRPSRRAPADRVTDAMAAGAAAGLAALTAATPAVDPAHAQPAAPDGVWEYTDPDGASAVLYRHPDGWTLRSHDCVLLPPDAVASLHAWLSQYLGQPAPVATDDSPAEPAEELIEVHHIARSR